MYTNHFETRQQRPPVEKRNNIRKHKPATRVIEIKSGVSFKV